MQQINQSSMIDNRILFYINKRGYTRQYVANQAGISRQHLHQIINNKDVPSAELAYRLTIVLHADFYDLFTFY